MEKSAGNESGRKTSTPVNLAKKNRSDSFYATHFVPIGSETVEYSDTTTRKEILNPSSIVGSGKIAPSPLSITERLSITDRLSESSRPSLDSINTAYTEDNTPKSSAAYRPIPPGTCDIRYSPKELEKMTGGVSDEIQDILNNPRIWRDRGESGVKTLNPTQAEIKTRGANRVFLARVEAPRTNTSTDMFVPYDYSEKHRDSIPESTQRTLEVAVRKHIGMRVEEACKTYNDTREEYINSTRSLQSTPRGSVDETTPIDQKV